MLGLFVTGTDTGVGKTAVCSALMHRYRKLFSLRYWKPVQTGVEEHDDTATVRTLGECSEAEILDQGARFKHPLSPHLAARLDGETLELARICQLPVGQAGKHKWIVEGAGGVLVPVNDTDFVTDLMKSLGLPVVIAARASLGTINHTLLTIEALRNRQLRIAGVVMVGEELQGNREAIEHYGKVEVLGEMPWFHELTAAALASWSYACLDPDNRLPEFMEIERSSGTS